ncbi:MAG: AbrB family transcriptional regulator [Alphaproteobacteria bacterium]
MGLGLGGGFVFFALDLPLAWMLGAMSFVTVAAIAGATVEVPHKLRGIMVAMLGALLGGAFTPEVLAQAGGWFDAMAVMAVFVVTVTVVVAFWMRKVGKLDRITAYCSATPGGLAIMAILGDQAGGDGRTIPLIHSTRILIVVFTVPLYLHFVLGFDVPSTAGFDDGHAHATAWELAILFACAGIGYGISRVTGSSNIQLLLPMLLSAGVHIAGIVEGRAPLALVALAQVVMGTSIGCRFVGMTVRQLARPVLLAVGSSAFMLTLAALVSTWLAVPLEVQQAAMMLALAPGGLAEMALVALAINVDTAFVSTMQIGRIMLVVVATPLVLRWSGLLGDKPPSGRTEQP